MAIVGEVRLHAWDPWYFVFQKLGDSLMREENEGASSMVIFK